MALNWDDLRILLVSMRNEAFDVYHLTQLRVSGNDPAMALVKLKKGDQEYIETAVGDGPVHAACSAVERIAGVTGRLEEFNVRAVTKGKDALGEAHVLVRFDNQPFTGASASTDIIEAAVQAYLHALNKYLALSAS